MDNEDSLDRLIDTLTARYPDVPAHDVAEHVYAAYSRLRATAEITTYLLTLTQRQAEAALAQRVRSDDVAV